MELIEFCALFFPFLFLLSKPLTVSSAKPGGAQRSSGSVEVGRIVSDGTCGEFGTNLSELWNQLLNLTSPGRVGSSAGSPWSPLCAAAAPQPGCIEAAAPSSDRRAGSLPTPAVLNRSESRFCWHGLHPAPSHKRGSPRVRARFWHRSRPSSSLPPTPPCSALQPWHRRQVQAARCRQR